MRLSKAAFVIWSVLACGACATKTAEQPEPAYARAENVPADMTARPHVVYEGRLVYYANDRWYVRNGPERVYYVDPPPELVRHEPHEPEPKAPSTNTAAVRAPEFGTPAVQASPSLLEPP